MLEYEVAKSASKSRCPSVTHSDKERAVNEWLKNSDQPPPSYSAPQQQQPIADAARAPCDDPARTYDGPPLATEAARAHVVDPARTYGRLPSARDIVKQQPPITKEAAQAPYVTPACTSAHVPPADSILQLAHTLKDMMTSSSTNQEERLLTRLSTPRELPAFSGDCIDWLHFRSAYDESSALCQFTDSEKLWRLRRALKGDAKEAVTDLLIGNTSPAVVMEALELRFGQSDTIVQHLTSQMRKLSPLPTNYQHDIVTFSMKINNCVATLHSLNQHDYLKSPEIATAIISKLPSILISRWTDYAYSKLSSNIPKLQLLAAFLKREAEMVSVVGVTNLRDYRKSEPPTLPTRKTYDDKHRMKFEDKHYTYTHRPVLATAAEVDTKPRSDGVAPCSFCKKSRHALTDCRPFRRAMRRDRWRHVKSKGLCFLCLQKHDRNACPAPVCAIDSCGMAHHHLLHYKKPHTHTPAEEGEESPTSITEAAEGESSSSHNETVAHALATAPPPRADPARPLPCAGPAAPCDYRVDESSESEPKWP
ncbi:hypothetical protein O0L34_g10243 [Tuta absoluta]|nr:hypothetical protein O0L34_g10243 [Tuta absoluta]